MPSFAIDAVALTRGSRGSTLYHGGNRWDMPPVQVVDLVDTVGAGDGFCAVLIAGYLRQRPWIEVLDQASRFASRICGIPGAIPDNDGIYSALRAWIG
jgi:fructokinase